MKYPKIMYRILTSILLIACVCTFITGCADTQNLPTATNASLREDFSESTTDAQSTENTTSTTEVSESVLDQTEPSFIETTHTHSYIKTVIPASCQKGGYTSCCCSCGHSYQTDFTDPIKHIYLEKVTAVTCTADGYSTFVCSVCLDSYTANVVKASGHSWTDWTTTKAATTTTEGVEQRECTTCGKVDTQSIAKLAYETFTGAIGKYNAHNKSYIDWQGSTAQAAFIEVYAISNDDSILESLVQEFKKVYGFAPSLGDKYRCTSSCEKVGTYMVEGYSDPQTVYHYMILDKSYIYITNNMYEVYVQQCADGSVWVGYCIYASMDTVSQERSKKEVQALDKEMYTTFEELIGLSRSEMNEHKEELSLKIGYISDAGTVRSSHTDGLVQVLYIYCRGFSVK